MKKVKNCTKLVPFFARDGRLRPKWTLFTLFVHYFKNTHSNHSLPLSSICRTTDHNSKLDLLFPKPAKRSTSLSKPSLVSSSFLLSLDIARTPQSDNREWPIEARSHVLMRRKQLKLLSQPAVDIGSVHAMQTSAKRQ